MNPKVRLRAALIISLVIVPVTLSCGGSSNSDLETSLRSQLSTTQSQLEQAQELITKLQDQIEALENTAQTLVLETETVEASATEETVEETPETQDDDQIFGEDQNLLESNKSMEYPPTSSTIGKKTIISPPINEVTSSNHKKPLPC